jgi:hypothetical protein
MPWAGRRKPLGRKTGGEKRGEGYTTRQSAMLLVGSYKAFSSKRLRKQLTFRKLATLLPDKESFKAGVGKSQVEMRLSEATPPRNETHFEMNP